MNSTSATSFSSTVNSDSPQYSNQSELFTYDLTTASGPSVEEQAAGFTIFHIGLGIHLYFLPFIVPIGFCGNILAFLVMSLVSEFACQSTYTQLYWTENRNHM